MKTKLMALLLATTTLGLLSGGVLAQTPPPAAAAPPPAPLTQAQPRFDPSQLPATHGTVRFFTLTPRGDVDGFILADGTQVHVPPHLSTQLVAAVRLGDAVTVRGLRAAAGREGLVISASRFGKAKMALQVVTIIALIAAPDASAIWLLGLVYLTVLVTIASGIDYFVAYRRRVPGDPTAVAVRPSAAAGSKPAAKRVAP